MAKAKKEETTAEEGSIQEAEPSTALQAQSQGSTEVQVFDFGEDAGAGMEDVTKEELRIPFINILQALSPQCAEPEQGGVPGARPGKLLNTATGEIYDGKEGFDFLPTNRDHNFPEFIPREQGGGFVAIHPIDDPLVAELQLKQGRFGKLITPENTEIIETYYLYGLVLLKSGVTFRAVLAFKSTQIKKYTTYVTRNQNLQYNVGGEMVNPPMWAHRWHVTTMPEKNKKGDFYGFKLSLSAKNEDGSEADSVKSLLRASDPLYIAAKKFHHLIKEGTVKADYAKSESEDGALSGTDEEM